MAVLSTHVGLGGEPGADRSADLRKVAIEFAAPGSGIASGALPQAVVECHNGECSPALVRANEVTGGYQVTFDVRLGGNPVELRCFLSLDDKPISETWLYRRTTRDGREREIARTMCAALSVGITSGRPTARFGRPPLRGPLLSGGGRAQVRLPLAGPGDRVRLCCRTSRPSRGRGDPGLAHRPASAHGTAFGDGEHGDGVPLAPALEHPAASVSLDDRLAPGHVPAAAAVLPASAAAGAAHPDGNDASRRRLTLRARLRRGVFTLLILTSAVWGWPASSRSGRRRPELPRHHPDGRLRRPAAVCCRSRSGPWPAVLPCSPRACCAAAGPRRRSHRPPGRCRAWR